jgi:acyl-coenzyme A thioesterase 13
MDHIRSWIERSPYSETLGVRIEEITESRVRLVLPYKDENSNPGKALHGGVAASMVALGGQAMCRSALGPEAAPWHTTGVQVGYLAAAVEETIVAEAALLRAGKQICFAEVDVHTEGGRAVAHGMTIVRGRFGAEPSKTPAAHGDDGTADPGPMGPHIGRVPFIKRLGLQVEHMSGGRSRIVMPFDERNADESGGVHEGAVLALLDTTGAMASWADTGPGPYKASTPGIQAQLLAPPDRSDLVGYGRVLFRDRELFLADVEVARADDRRLVARGAVNYRIVVPESES